MVRREIELDETTDQILTKLAEDHQGNLGQALAELVQAHDGLERIADQCEEIHRDSLLKQVSRSEADFAEGRTLSWEEVKRRNGL
jgi:hypothetical protein